ncbi:Extradiol aromatic ring-opening dioxygenase [Macrolepiota fuliginosa MF-IS2]|uniref:Extradiol aromatic ring-opening dioxygenase n=1 Tax=Macrolepiota fuliginosa MF-IS2 TaxID=1400762 RepID=A0A9P5XPI0_9AGAR|nr:Extradiol aromatic ring-opening dioxygenase [Macrolepiota fuliginosa MF-IS2]
MDAQVKWRKALEELPATPAKIPSFFFAHGSPVLAFPDDGQTDPMMAYQGPRGSLAAFLRDFGPALLKKYNPKGIVVFSAHWETLGERLVTDYGDNQPLLMDYYGFPPQLYQLKFVSRGDAELSKRVVDLYKEHGYLARTTSKLEPRGEDGRGFQGPGLDHGVFVPFRLMFGEEFTDIPIVQVSIDSSMSPEKNWALGKAVAKLREEGILVLSGGLTAHNLRDRRSFSPTSASEDHKAFDRAIHSAINIADAGQRKKALFDLTQHTGFRASQPREDHFVPLYVAAGAGEGEVRVICDLYGIPTFAFGV